MAEGTRDVALLIETSNAYARSILTGIRAFATAAGNWSLYLAEHSRQETDFSWLQGWRGDGVLARIETAQTAAFIRELGLPTVDLSAAGLAPHLPCVETDDATIIEIAMEHFAERGIRAFGFCGDARFGWSVNRAVQFAANVRQRGGRAHEFALAPSGVRAHDRERLADWLVRLPKPVGVLACYDIAGQEVLEACKLAGLSVPDEVAVLGVDNDELICTMSSPPLSSVQSDGFGTGYKAASLLEDMMSGREVPPGVHAIPPVRVVVRRSSDNVFVDDPLVAAALRFIQEHADRAVSVAETVRRVGLSRRALDMRFSSELGRTVHAEIVRVRLSRVAELLTTTDWTLPRIAERLEFAHAEYMAVMFKAHTGLSPGQFRQRMLGRGSERATAD